MSASCRISGEGGTGAEIFVTLLTHHVFVRVYVQYLPKSSNHNIRTREKYCTYLPGVCFAASSIQDKTALDSVLSQPYITRIGVVL
jgi:hypothetical protein